MNSFVMSHEAWLLFWSRSACPVCLPTGVCGVGPPAFDIGADNDQRNHFAASLWRQQWPGANSVDILADHMKAHASLRGRLPARCQMTRAMVSARTSDAPARVRDARRRIQCGPGGHHIIDQYYGLASNCGTGTDGKGTSQIALAGLT